MFLDRGGLGRAGVVAEDVVGRLGGWLEGDATVTVIVMERLNDGGRRNEVDGLVAGKGGELSGETKERPEETVG